MLEGYKEMTTNARFTFSASDTIHVFTVITVE